MNSSSPATQVTKTLAEGKAKWCADHNIPISYSHALILQLPKAMQDSVWKINSFLLKHSNKILCTGLAVGAAVYIFSAVPFTTVLGATALGILALSISGGYGVNLKSDDKSWILVAAMLASLALTWPISLSASLALLCPRLGPQRDTSPSEAFLDKYQSPEVKKARKEDALHEKMEEYTRAKALTELQSILLNSKLKLEKDFNVSDYNEFTVALEAYVRKAADSECSQTPQEIRDFLCGVITFWKGLKKDVGEVYKPDYAAKKYIIQENRILMEHSWEGFFMKSLVTYSNSSDGSNEPTLCYTPCPSYTKSEESNKFEVHNNTTDRVLICVDYLSEQGGFRLEPGEKNSCDWSSLAVEEYKILGQSL